MSIPFSKAYEKLGSFDADLRYMGLNDIQTLLRSETNVAGLTVRIRNAIIALLEDPISEVQNQAIKTLGSIVRVGIDTEKVIETISENQSLPASIKALAYRSIISNTPTESFRAVASLILREVRGAKTVDELNVIIDLLRVTPSPLTPNQVWQMVGSIIDMLSTNSESRGSGLYRLRAFEALKLGIPLVKDPQQWGIIEEFFCSMSRGESPELTTGSLQLASWLGESNLDVDAMNLLWDSVRPLVTALVSSPPNEDESVDLCEGSLMVLKSFSTRGITLPLTEAVSICSLLVPWDLLYNRDETSMDFDKNADISNSDDDFDEQFSDSDDESFRVRKWAVRYAGTLSNTPVQSEILSILVSALGNERDENTRTEIYDALGLFPDIPEDAVIAHIEKDSTNHSALKLLLIMINSGSKYNVDTSRALKIARKASTKRSLLTLALEIVKAINVGTDDSSTAIVFTAFSTADHSIQLLALATASVLKNPLFTIESLKIARYAADDGLKSAALTTAATVCTTTLAPEVVSFQEQLLLREPPHRKMAASAMSVLFKRSILDTAISLQAIKAVGETLEMNPLPSVATECYNTLRFAGEFLGLSPVIVRAIVNGPTQVAPQVKALISQASDPSIINWILNASNLPDLNDEEISLLSDLVLKASRHTPSLYASLRDARSRPSTVAAAIVGSGVSGIDTYNDLDLIAALAKLGKETVFITDLIDHIVSEKAHSPDICADALGSIASLNENSLNELLGTNVRNLGEDIWLNALGRVATQRPDFSSNIQKALIVPGCGAQIAPVLAKIIVAQGDISTLADLSDEILVATAQQALQLNPSGPLARDLLMIIIESLEKKDHNYPQTPATVAWAVKSMEKLGRSEDIRPFIGRIIHGLCAAANARDPSKVRVVQMGPFKHKLDDQMALRQSAIEALYSLIPQFRSELSEETVEAVMSGLSDSEHDVKIMACHAIMEMFIVRPDLLHPYLPQVEAIFETELEKKVKDTVVKQEHDKRDAIVRAITEARSVMF